MWSSYLNAGEETKKLNVELEEQYQQGLDLKMSGSSRRHVGLGFQDVDNNDRGTVDAETSSAESGLLAGEEKEESRDCDIIVPKTTDDEEKVEEKPADDNENKSSNVKNANTVIGGFVRGSSS
jgi:hypothetical protein